MKQRDTVQEAQYIEEQMKLGNMNAVERELQELFKDKDAYRAVMAKMQADLKSSALPGHVEIGEDGTVVLDFGPQQGAKAAATNGGEKTIGKDDEMIVVTPDGTITDTRQQGAPAGESHNFSTVTVFADGKEGTLLDNPAPPTLSDLELNESQFRQVATREMDPRERLYGRWYQAQQTGNFDNARDLADEFNKTYPHGNHSEYMTKVAANYNEDPAGAMLHSYHKALESGNFYMALSLGSRFVKEHDDRPESVAMRNWMTGVSEASQVTLDLSMYVSSEKAPTEYEMQQMVAEKLGFKDADIAMLGAQSGKDNPLSMFFKESGDDGCQRLLELASANKNGLVNIGDLYPGAIDQLKAFHKKLNPEMEFEPLPLVQATGGEKLALDVWNTGAQFVNGAAGSTADMIDGVGAAAGLTPIGIFGGDQYIHDAAKSLRNFGESLPMMGAYTDEDLNSAERCLLLFGAQTMGAAAPYLVGTAIKGVGWAARGAQGARALAFGSEIEGAAALASEASGLAQGTSRVARAIDFAKLAAEAGVTPKGAVIVNEFMGSMGNAGAMYNSTRDTFYQQWADQHHVSRTEAEKMMDAKTKEDIEFKSKVTGMAGAIVGLLNPANVPALSGLSEGTLKATQKLMVEKLANQFIVAGSTGVALEALNRTILATATGDPSRLKDLGKDSAGIFLGGMISAIPGMAAEAAIGRNPAGRGQEPLNPADADSARTADTAVPATAGKADTANPSGAYGRDSAAEAAATGDTGCNGVTVDAAPGQRVARNREGRISETVNANGERHTFEYSGDRISKITEPDGTVLERTGDNSWRCRNNGKESMMLKVDYSIDSNGSLITRTPDGSIVRHLDGRQESLDLRGRPESGNSTADINVERTNLMTKANDMVDSLPGFSETARERYKASFEELAQRIEDRQVRDPIDDAKIAETYKHISRLLEDNPSAPVARAHRVLLAEQLMHEAAFPSVTDQGANNTCNVTTVENRIATRDPAEIAALVTEVATTGQYVTSDGSVIDMRGHLNPDAEASAFLPTQLKDGPSARDGQRSYASQIFQTTAVNIHWQTTTTAPDGTACAPGDVAYRIIGGQERLVNTRTGAEYRQPDGQPYDAPSLSLGQIEGVHNHIVGRTDSEFIVSADSEVLIGNGRIKLNNPENLSRFLVHAKSEGKLPVIITVGSDVAPDGRVHSTHVFTVRDYDPRTGNAEVINQWGKQHDRLLGRPMKVEELNEQMFDCRRNAVNGRATEDLPPLDAITREPSPEGGIPRDAQPAIDRGRAISYDY